MVVQTGEHNSHSNHYDIEHQGDNPDDAPAPPDNETRPSEETTESHCDASLTAGHPATLHLTGLGMTLL